MTITRVRQSAGTGRQTDWCGDACFCRRPHKGIRREFATALKTIMIKDLKNTGEVSELCSETNEPISIIRNGYSVLVVISIAGYEKRQADLWKNGD